MKWLIRVLVGIGCFMLSQPRPSQQQGIADDRYIRQRHGRIFINPALINSGYNRHSFDALPGSVLYRHALRLRRKLLDGAAKLRRIARS